MNSDQLAQLAAPLDAARVKSRPGRGGGTSLSYLETHDVIRRANEIFGHGQWGHEVVELRPLEPVVVKKDDVKEGVHVGYLCTVRLTVQDCVPVSGIGFGDAVEYTLAAAVTAHELAAKEAESDALKRALKNYGDQFGLALYDKQAASSGHVVKEAPKPALSVEVIAEFTRVAEAWQAINAAFNAAAAVKEASKHNDAWVTVAKTKLQGYITEALDAEVSQTSLEGQAA